MRIKEQDEQQMVITPRFGNWLVKVSWSILFLFLLELASFTFLSSPPLGIVLLVLWILFILGLLIGNRVILKKATQTITFEKRHFLMISTRRVIPFSEVRSVVIDYEAEASSRRRLSGQVDAWKVSINIIGEKLKIDRTTNKENMVHLASEISSFIGTEQVDKSMKPDMLLVSFIKKAEELFVKVFRKGEHTRRQVRMEKAEESSNRRIQELDRAISKTSVDKKQNGKP